MVAVGLMTILMFTRNTRAEEESGRLDLVRADRRRTPCAVHRGPHHRRWHQPAGRGGRGHRQHRLRPAGRRLARVRRGVHRARADLRWGHRDHRPGHGELACHQRPGRGRPGHRLRAAGHRRRRRRDPVLALPHRAGAEVPPLRGRRLVAPGDRRGDRRRADGGGGGARLPSGHRRRPGAAPARPTRGRTSSGRASGSGRAPAARDRDRLGGRPVPHRRGLRVDRRPARRADRRQRHGEGPDRPGRRGQHHRLVPGDDDAHLGSHRHRLRDPVSAPVANRGERRSGGAAAGRADLPGPLGHEPPDAVVRRAARRSWRPAGSVRA